MQNRAMIYGASDAQDLSSQLTQLKAAGCEKVFRDKLTGATTDRPKLRKLMSALSHGDVVIIPAVDRLSHDTTDLLVVARDMQRAGAGIRSLADPFLDTTPDFAEIVFAILGVAAKARMPPHSRTHGAGAAQMRRPRESNSGRKPKLTLHQQREARARLKAGKTQRPSQLQCQSGDDF
jgi:DNA invertase Pin-like site-specific DNA recombinase